MNSNSSSWEPRHLLVAFFALGLAQLALAGLLFFALFALLGGPNGEAALGVGLNGGHRRQEGVAA